MDAMTKSTTGRGAMVEYIWRRTMREQNSKAMK